jgi:hypothetical protein
MSADRRHRRFSCSFTSLITYRTWLACLTTLGPESARQCRVEPFNEEVAVIGEDLPGASVPTGASPRSHEIDHGAEDLVAERLGIVRRRQLHNPGRGDGAPILAIAARGSLGNSLSDSSDRER